MADELRVPRKVNGTWEPFNPSQWRAYAPRQRLFRTPNDAFMTGNFHVAQSLMQKALNKQGYGWVQLLLASVYSGAFHPSAEGQAAIADAVVDKARAVLAKYEKRASARPGASISACVEEPEWLSAELRHSAILTRRCTCRIRSDRAARTLRIRANRLVRASRRCATAAQCTTARSAPATAAPIRSLRSPSATWSGWRSISA